ncbi:MAG: hypothetical protein R3190_11630 [Thermoanaerobaculia bacterium]|nr:hypothetical protein [Thermoanaerobaculia bacterium]
MQQRPGELDNDGAAVDIGRGRHRPDRRDAGVAGLGDRIDGGARRIVVTAICGGG